VEMLHRKQSLNVTEIYEELNIEQAVPFIFLKYS
jgi:hypothetical protein